MSEGPIVRDPDILGGTPVFDRTRVPVRILMEYLEAGESARRLPTGLPFGVPAIKPSQCWKEPG